ncbi:hypothetical protein [Streptomyces sp. VRA16 Mangrove soil]|uniref:AMIN-like domain-containing (lipo)protein n=1 Tax=Streptomyces sp. VRA16 Mangrove soil TaxID=2817434 RepID=UPI001A9DA362|nr:hypothetical protein [Streptomyces sp. VRA16 Mangrove soil]MBO1331376.1 hypothetical protein [Streptomyces sp. VRA16 Mangrove soil]
MPSSRALTRRAAPVSRLLTTGGALAGILLAGLVPSASATTVTPSATTAVTATATTITPDCHAACFVRVRTGAYADYDRIVVDLGGPDLPYLEYEFLGGTGLTPMSGKGDGSEPRVPLDGKTYLTLQFFGATTYTTSGAAAFIGATPKVLDMPSVKGYAVLGSFEGHAKFGLALGDLSDYHVFFLSNPNRLVIDVYH